MDFKTRMSRNEEQKLAKRKGMAGLDSNNSFFDQNPASEEEIYSWIN